MYWKLFKIEGMYWKLFQNEGMYWKSSKMKECIKKVCQNEGMYWKLEAGGLEAESRRPEAGG